MRALTARRTLIAALGSTLLLGATLAQAQDKFPSKAVRFVIPTAPGGNLDLLARIVAGKLADAWGQQVVVEPRPGANTILATTAVAFWATSRGLRACTGWVSMVRALSSSCSWW